MDSRNNLYRSVGEAIHCGQALEINIRVLITIINRNSKEQIDSDKIFLAEDKKTLGRLIELLRPLVKFSDETEVMLKDALIARNYIAHDFFIRHTDAFTSEAAMMEAQARLHERARQVILASAVSGTFVQGLCEALNLKLSDLQIRQDI